MNGRAVVESRSPIPRRRLRSATHAESPATNGPTKTTVNCMDKLVACQKYTSASGNLAFISCQAIQKAAPRRNGKHSSATLRRDSILSSPAVTTFASRRGRRRSRAPGASRRRCGPRRAS
jgi:hypothetical protein